MATSIGASGATSIGATGATSIGDNGDQEQSQPQRWERAVEQGREAIRTYLRAWSPENLFRPDRAVRSSAQVVRQSWAFQRAVWDDLVNFRRN